MALQGTLSLDTAQFQRSLKEATASMQAFGLDTTKVAENVRKMASSLDGSKIVQQANQAAAAINAIGGATSLTEKEARKHLATIDEARAKYAALGQQVPQHLNAVAKELGNVAAQSKGLSGWAQTALGTFTGFLSAQAVIGAVGGAFKAVGTAAIDMNASLDKSTLQFETLMGDAGKARDHVAMLFEFAKTTPFETGPIIDASKKLQVFGGDALNTEKNLRLIGDAAAATGAPIEEVGQWVGRLYANLAAGRPIGEAAQRLTELAVIGPQARAALEQVAAGGGSVEDKFKVMQDALGQFSGAMDKQSRTWGGLMSTLSDAANMAIAQGLRPLYESALEALGGLTDLTSTSTFDGWVESVRKASQSLVDHLKAAFLGIRGLAAELRLDLLKIAETFQAMALGIAEKSKSVLDMVASGGGLTGAAAGAMSAKIGGAIPSIQAPLGPLAAMIADEETRLEELKTQTVLLALKMGGTSAKTEALWGPFDTVKTGAGALGTATGKLAKVLEDSIYWIQSEWLPELGRFGEDLLGGAGGGNLWTGGKGLAAPGLTPMALQELFGYKAPDTSGGFKSLPWGGVGMLPGYLGAGGSQSTLGTPGFLSQFGSAISGNLGSVITSAFSGGGSIGKTIGSSLLGTAGNLFGNTLSKAMSGLGGLAPKLLGTLGGALGPIGSLVGGMIGPLISKLFAPKEGKLASQDRAAYIQQLGGNEAFNQRLRDAQIAPEQAASLTNSLMSANSRQAVEAAEKAIEAAIARNTELLKEQATIQDQVAALTEKRKALEESLIPTYDDIVKVTAKYGINLDAAGAKVEQLGATKTWTDMLNDIQLLERGGFDVGTMLDGMADDISKVAQRSQKFGTEIPAQMKPYLQSLSEAGRLLDANGNNITDLSTLKWGPAVATQADIVQQAMADLNKTMDGLVARLKDIVDLLANRIPGAASDAADAVSTVNLPSGREGVEDVPAMASGGVVTRPTLALIGERGPEAVIPLSRMGGMSRPIVVQNVLDGRLLSEVVLDQTGRMVRTRRRA